MSFKIMQVNFRFNGPWGTEQAKGLEGLGRGCRSHGVSDIEYKIFDVNVPLTEITHGKLY